MNNKTAILIPTYKRVNKLKKCIESLGLLNENFTVVVINDGGDLETTAYLKTLDITYVEIVLNEGIWWTKSINEGINYALNNSFDSTLILNDDVTMSKNFIEEMSTKHILHPEKIIIPIVYSQNKTIWSAGGCMSWPLYGEKHCLEIKDNNSENIYWAPGMGMWVPLEVYSKIGVFNNKDYPQYLSDADFGLRATKKGIKFLLNKDCYLVNDVGATGGILKNKINIKDILSIFTSLRSPDYFPARLKFIYYHAPLGLKSISLVIRLLKIAAFSAKRYFR